jgi:hypothetical protein
MASIGSRERWLSTRRLGWLLWGALWLSAYVVAIPREVMRANWEETVNGNVARGIVEGLIVSPWYYQYQPWAHGPFVIGLILTPVYALFGSTRLWIKLAGSLFAIGGTAAWISVARRSFGARTALLFAAWWLLPPPYLSGMLHVVWANHMESIFWTGMLVAAFSRAGSVVPGFAGVAGTALVAGFASFFCMQNLLPAAALVVVSVWRWKMAGLRRMLWPGFPCFLVGYVPHVICAWVITRPRTTGARVTGWGIAREVFSSATGYFASWGASRGFIDEHSQPGRRLWDLFTQVVPRAGVYDSPTVSRTAGLLVLVGLAVATVRYAPWPIRRGTADREAWTARLMLVWLVGYAFAYAFGTFYVAEFDESYWFRYLLPLFPVGMLLTASLLARLPVRAGWLVLLPFLVASANDLAPIRQIREAGRTLRQGVFFSELTAQRGDDFGIFLGNDWLGGFARPSGDVPWGYAVDLRGAAATLPGLSPVLIPMACEEMGFRAGSRAALDELAARGDVATACGVALARGAGRAAVEESVVARAAGKDDSDAVGAALVHLAAWDTEAAEAFAEGVGYELVVRSETGTGRRATVHGPRVTPWDEPDDASSWLAGRMVDRASESQRLALVRGMGRRIGSLGFRAVASLVPIEQVITASDVSAGERDAAARGRAEGYADYVIDHDNRIDWPAFVTPSLVREALERRGVSLVRSDDRAFPWRVVLPVRPTR